MSFTHRILLEHSVKYILFVLIVISLLETIRNGLNKVSQSGTLESLALIMSLIAVASITAYFTFSYTTVGKSFQRFFGYLCTFFLGLSILLSIVVIYFIATIQVPELSPIWLIILSSLLIGIILFDNLDLLRMGLDVSATTFFENAERYSGKNNAVESITKYLREGHRLSYVNGLIGQALIEVGIKKNNSHFTDVGQWILENVDGSQQLIDNKIVDTFSSILQEDRTIRHAIEELKKGQSQYIADNLIATVIERANNIL